MNEQDRYEKIAGRYARTAVIEELTHSEVLSICKKKNPTAYWGINTLGDIHSGYIVHFNKIKDLVDAGFKVTVFFADVHSSLSLEKRDPVLFEVSKKITKLFMNAIGIDLSRIKFSSAEDIVYNSEYFRDLIKLSRKIPFKRITKALPVGLRQDPRTLGEAIYPVLQNLDFKHLKVDLAIHTTDQRHTWILGRDFKNILRISPTCLLYKPMLDMKGNVGMCGRVSQDKLYVYDSPPKIHKKIQLAFCPLNKKNNPILEHVYHYFYAFGEQVKIDNITFDNYKKLESSFLTGKIHPLKLKKALSEKLVDTFKPITVYLKDNPYEKEVLLNCKKRCR